MRSSLLVVLCFLLASPSLAQHSGGGLKGGLRFTDYTGGEVSTGVKLGWEAGVFGRIQLSRLILFQLEGGYTPLGDYTLTSQYDAGEDPVYGPVILERRTALEAAFVDLPLLASALIPAGDAEVVWIRLGAGGATGIRTSCTIATRSRTVTSEGTVVSENLERADCPAGTASVTFSPVVGGGLDVHVGRYVVVTDLRYEFGLTSMLPSAGGRFRGISMTAGMGMRF